MNAEIRNQSLRFLVLLLLQVLVLRQVSLGTDWLRYGEVLVYPLFLMMLPMRMHTGFQVGLAFLMGLLVDLFYDTPGVHAAAATASTYFRPLILRLIEPRSGYDLRQPLTRKSFGMGWFTTYTALFLLLHIFLVQLLSVFTFYYFGELLLRTLLTWVLSLTVLYLQDLLMNPQS